MATKEFKYQEMFPLREDTTEYYHLTSAYVHEEDFGGRKMLVVEPEALRTLARKPSTI